MVVGVLRLSAEKRPLDFVEAVARLTSRVPDVRAFLVGDGPEAPRVRERVARLDLGAHLTVVGHSDHPARYLAIADVSLLPSEYEGCPNAVLEAQALGVPAIVTDVGGSPETVVDGASGFVCAVGDLVGMSERAARVAAEPDRGRAMGRLGRRHVMDEFGSTRMIEAVLASYA
ncbi:MAG: glycosyltransferase [Deltaproteobacteria bacterium]|nr:glycosyltransferase [Deltaproteobacteria bacterium]